MYDFKKSTWLNPDIEYLFNSEITEYDAKDAGFSIIKEFHLLDTNEISKLDIMEKMERHRTIGKIQGSDKVFSNQLMKKFAEIRKVFILSNNLNDNDIISVKKDAIFVTRTCDKCKFGKITFVPKNKYTSYMRFVNNMNIELYFNPNHGFDVKGIGDSGINRHRLYMLDFLKNVISFIECKDKSVKRYLRRFIREYKNMELDEEYYIEFNNLSKDYNPMYNFQKIIIPIVQLVMKEID